MRWLACLVLLPMAVSAQLTVGLPSSTDTPVVPFDVPLTNNPISLITMRTQTQTLADGTHIVHTSREMFYRDAQGRIRTETETKPPGAASASTHRVTVDDPIANRVISWTENPASMRKEYFVYTFAQPPMMIGTPPPPPDPSDDIAPPRPPHSASAANRLDTQHQILGTRDIQGLLCRAERTTTPYPGNFLGNDQPIVVTDERCVSRELRRTLQEIRVDPRSGVMTVAVELVSHENPSPTLFRPPPDYVERATAPIEPPLQP